ncbi:uncharacterized protein LOC110367657 isoform X3 [Fundulus heteroclitus]|uniref:uncharacterized protein LOC110367657 isoform X3 n=1 Tax=Fundulus heteroclitus TaxID=8078 RepID=UPI00165CC6BD|nr:uncharacterized protein LOC110367657 isoform X3 [Fundulus heteroclitus]
MEDERRPQEICWKPAETPQRADLNQHVWKKEEEEEDLSNQQLWNLQSEPVHQLQMQPQSICPSLMSKLPRYVNSSP